MQTTTPTIPNVPLPPGAVRVFDWEHPRITGLPETQRYFDGTTRTVKVELPHRCWDIEVTIEGTQYADGRVEPRVIAVRDVDADSAMTLAQVRALAAALLEAANEAEGAAK